jgi:hypothetical protein
MCEEKKLSTAVKLLCRQTEAATIDASMSEPTETARPISAKLKP